MADGKIPVRKNEKIDTIIVFKYGIGAQECCRISVPEGIQTWLNKALSNLPWLGLFSAGAWTGALQASFSTTVFLWLFECQPPCLAQIRATHSLWKAAFFPPLSSSLLQTITTMGDWLITDPRHITTSLMGVLCSADHKTVALTFCSLSAHASPLCYSTSWVELSNKQYY